MTWAGLRELATKRAGSASHCTTSILSPLAAKLIDDVLDTDATQAHTGTHGVDPFLAGCDGHLAAVAGLAGDRPDLHHAPVYLRHFQLEQASKEVLVSAGEDELGAFDGPVYLQQ